MELIQADVRAMPFGDEVFDVVLDFGTCYHLPPADTLRPRRHRGFWVSLEKPAREEIRSHLP